ncbi:zinc finger, C3HC4 type (RING finger) domain-containing protein [Toxoplasma gondii VAND]|uniref:RING-type E3 ubiquitin transferase n=2 Tax=Toxoplasma gondii TaxID=5811 RepID=A0A086L4B2_TOXGO|nr:zinc finger, C3HC4 type (RING finger) domain-containing protein [Toxoplasma gondii p89]KFH11477.1 zinc finger, C3HC4 type (RING finger) domain-containing protein [Toxoplasma gondii VAND]
MSPVSRSASSPKLRSSLQAGHHGSTSFVPGAGRNVAHCVKGPIDFSTNELRFAAALPPSPCLRGHLSGTSRTRLSTRTPTAIPPPNFSGLTSRCVAREILPPWQVMRAHVGERRSTTLSPPRSHSGSPIIPHSLFRRTTRQSEDRDEDLVLASTIATAANVEKRESGKDKPWTLLGISRTSVPQGEVTVPLAGRITGKTIGSSWSLPEDREAPNQGMRKGGVTRHEAARREIISSERRRDIGRGTSISGTLTERDLGTRLFRLNRFSSRVSVPLAVEPVVASSAVSRTGVSCSSWRAPPCSIRTSTVRRSAQLGVCSSAVHASVNSLLTDIHYTRETTSGAAAALVREAVQVQSFVDTPLTTSGELARGDVYSGRYRESVRGAASRSRRRDRLPWVPESRVLPPVPEERLRSGRIVAAPSLGRGTWVSPFSCSRNSNMNRGTSRRRDTHEGTDRHEATRGAALSSRRGGTSGSSSLVLPSPSSVGRLLDQAGVSDLEDDLVFHMWLEQEAVLERALPLQDMLAGEEALERALIASMTAVGRRDLDQFLLMLQQPLLLLHQSGRWRSAGFAGGTPRTGGWARLWGFDSAVRVAGGSVRPDAERNQPLSEAEISRSTRRWTFTRAATENKKGEDGTAQKSTERNLFAPTTGEDSLAPPRRQTAARSWSGNLSRPAARSSYSKQGLKSPPMQPGIAAQPPVPPGAIGSRESASGGSTSAHSKDNSGSLLASSGASASRNIGGGRTSTDMLTGNTKREELGPTGDSNRCCCICLAEYQTGDDMMTLRCMHMFHYDCVHDWLVHSGRRTCPLCLVAIKEGEGKGEEDFIATESTPRYRQLEGDGERVGANIRRETVEETGEGYEDPREEP